MDLGLRLPAQRASPSTVRLTGLQVETRQGCWGGGVQVTWARAGILPPSLLGCETSGKLPPLSEL